MNHTFEISTLSDEKEKKNIIFTLFIVYMRTIILYNYFIINTIINYNHKIYFYYTTTFRANNAGHLLYLFIFVN
jgi:hypothetical protein